jgi:hypothetical protein
MFYDCSSLKRLNLSNFKINIQDIILDVFTGCSSLKYLTCSDETILKCFEKIHPNI